MITIVDNVSGNRTCIDCLLFLCPPGEGLTVKCRDVITSQTSILCKPCVLGETYSDALEPGSCKDCMNCGKYRETKKACTLTSKAVCGKCVTGAYPEGLLGTCVPCSHCCNDEDDVIIAGCQVPGVPKNMRCTFARSEKCSRNITRQVLLPTTPTTTLAKALRLQTRSASVSHTQSGKKTVELQEEELRIRNKTEKAQEEQTQLMEGVESDRKNDSKIKWIRLFSLNVAFAVAAIATMLVCRLKQSRRKDRPSQKPPVKSTGDSPLPYPVKESKSGNIASEKGI